MPSDGRRDDDDDDDERFKGDGCKVRDDMEWVVMFVVVGKAMIPVGEGVTTPWREALNGGTET